MSAQPSLFDAKLKRQTQRVLDVLRERGSLTPREARELVGTERLAARIAEIRETYGERAVETQREPNRNGGHHARYVWRGAA